MTSTGLAPFGEYQTWYTISGDLKAQRPLVVLHGGPGGTHLYMVALNDLTEKLGVPVLNYDQIGCGKSTWLNDKGAEFWTFDLFLSELDSLLKHLDICEYDLLGHSWGAMLAAEHAARQPEGLKHLILSDGPADVHLLMKEMERLLSELPQDVQDTIKKHEDEGTTDSEEYQAAAGVFYAKHVCRLQPMPPALQESFAALQANPHVYGIIQGPSEFRITGTMKTWSIVDRLHRIKVKTLLLNGEYDEITDANIKLYIEGVSGAKWVQLKEASHMIFWEQRTKYMEVVGEFIKN